MQSSHYLLDRRVLSSPSRCWARWPVLALSLLVVSGCSWFSWLPWVDGDDNAAKESAKPAKLEKFDEEVRVKRLWGATVGDGLGRKLLRLAPAVLADQVFAADGYGNVQAFERFNGKRLWRARIGEPIGRRFSGLRFWDRRDPSFVTGGVGAGDGRVLVGTSRGEVIALAADDGRELWRIDVGSEVLAAPLPERDLVFVQTMDGRIIALEADTGAQRWAFDNQVPILTLRGSARPVVDGDLVVAGFANGMVAALRIDTGEPVWEQRIQIPKGRSELDRMVDVDGRPVAVGGVLYAASFQGQLRAMGATDGRALWAREASTYLDLATGYGLIYLADADGSVHAMDRTNGEDAWRNDALARRGLSPPIAFSNYLAVGDADGYLHVLAQSDGRFLGRRKLDGDGIASAMLEADDVLYVLGNGGKLVALQIEPLE